MGKSEMAEIASLVHTVLSQTKPAVAASGEVSKAKYEIASGVKEQAQARISDLLKGFPLYPELGAL